MDEQRLHARGAHARPMAERDRDLISMGGGARISGAQAGQPRPGARGTAETPAPPKRVAAEFLSAVPTNLQKKFQKKDVPGVDRICSNCYFAVTDYSKPAITCHARPPKPSSTTDRVMWPMVYANDWCGEWCSAGETIGYIDEFPA